MARGKSAFRGTSGRVTKGGRTKGLGKGGMYNGRSASRSGGRHGGVRRGMTPGRGGWGRKGSSRGMVASWRGNRINVNYARGGKSGSWQFQGQGGQGGGERPSGAKGWEDRSYGGSSSSDSADRDGRSRRRRGTAPDGGGSSFSGDENTDYGGAAEG